LSEALERGREVLLGVDIALAEEQPAPRGVERAPGRLGEPECVLPEMSITGGRILSEKGQDRASRPQRVGLDFSQTVQGILGGGVQARAFAGSTAHRDLKAEVNHLKIEGILSAATRLFSERGYANCTVDDIAHSLSRCRT
jgi:hypothetical protein